MSVSGRNDHGGEGRAAVAASYSPLDHGAAFAGCIVGDCALVPLEKRMTFFGFCMTATSGHL
jgi:hypothetical protein